MMHTLPEIGRRLREQDNLCTEHPIFLVQQKVRFYGVDPEYCEVASAGSGLVWLHCDDGEADRVEAAGLDALFEKGEDTPPEWTRTGYVDRWEFVTCCFTAAAAVRYIEANKHNLGESRVYAASAHRNPEFIAVREHLMGLGTGKVPADGESA